MSDCADILPRILELHSLTTENPDHALTESQLNKACREYEAAMIPRAFTWVRKSGGSKVPVSAPRPQFQPRHPWCAQHLHCCGEDGKVRTV